MSDFTEHLYTSQDGLRLYYRVYGSSQLPSIPVLCLPGFTRNSADFHLLALRLSSSRQVICPDYRGRGRSDYDRHTKNYQPSVYLEDIRHLLTVTGTSRAVIIGTSMGGLLAMGLGVTSPNLLEGVILNDIGPTVGGGLHDILEYAGTDHTVADWENAANEFSRIHPNTVFQTDNDRERAIRATWNKKSDGMLHVDWDIRIVLPLLNGAVLPDLWKLFRSLRRVPVLAIRGEISDILCRNTLQRMILEHPSITTVEVKRTGHAPSLNEPESTSEIRTFLNTL